MRGKMWKKVSAMAAAVCLVLCMVPIGVHAEENTWGTYVALGDSITSGYGLGEGESAFPDLVAGTCGLTLSNQAVTGATSEDVLTGLTSGSLKVAGADVVTITIGGNDLMGALYIYLANKYNEVNPGAQMNKEQMQEAILRGDVAMLAFASGVIEEFSGSAEAQTALGTFGTNIAGIIGTIRKLNTEAMIIVVNQYNPYAYLASSIQIPQIKAQAQIIASAFEAGVQGLNAVISQVENQPGCFVADAYSAIAGAGENPCNAAFVMQTMSLNLDFHPNAYGHELIAESVCDVVNRVKQISEALEAQIAAIQKVTALNFVQQKDIATAEAAKSWAESLITPALVPGVTVDVQIVGFQAAEAGTEQDSAGTDGSFQISITLSCGDYILEDAVTINTQIKASAYTAPAEDPEKDETATTDDDKAQTSQKDEEKNKPAEKTEKAENTAAKSPVTGDASDLMLYVLLILTAGVVTVVAALRRRSEGR